ncbi:GNAT family N-acetyltransferase [Streptacidiphilus jiangxiensis]|uniref:Predicted acetyltransferase n=1 Tax=Streptacidiphilus jiangxiensis TaxID=235985 RepID=A0A1H7HQJ0_STRJI|nr:GNAT family N-acetyltransferase [Streptacidiphilus jiangxiensis]SEK50495.1 Predicted acetyltransferase [Streptacidiphilus jiangxiensis]
MEIRPTTDQDVDVFLDNLHTAFGMFRDPDNTLLAGYEWDRNLMAWTEDGRAVGTTGAYSFELTLPGAVVVPVAGVTGVTVLPTHRRQGVLKAMMRHQLDALRERGEFLSVLLASEATIYRRFGYGPATYTQRLTVARHRNAPAAPRAGAQVAPDAGTVEVLTRADSGEILEQVYDRYRRLQPGALSRPAHWWERGAGQPPVSPAPRFVAVHRDADGTPDGYATYTISRDASPSSLSVDEVIAVDDTVAAALTRVLLDHDLVDQVVFRRTSTEDPLFWQLADFRAAEVSGFDDWLWVRILDVPRALTSRAWFADGELVLEVADGFANAGGRFLLSVRDGKASCERTDREADLSLDVSDLGSVYLGGTTPSTLVRAGQIRAHRPGAAALADTLFRSDRTPYCLHWF